MDLEAWDGLETKAEMNSLAIGIISVIMGDLSTSANAKVDEIARTLADLEHVWGIKKTLAPTRVPKEVIHPECTIDLSRVESLLDPPRPARFDTCHRCQCWKCVKKSSRQMMFPSTKEWCATRCDGSGVRNCPFESEEEIK